MEESLLELGTRGEVSVPESLLLSDAPKPSHAVGHHSSTRAGILSTSVGSPGLNCPCLGTWRVRALERGHI